jgi:hypothetical protein
MKKLLAAVCVSVCLLGAPFAKADTVFCNNYSSHLWLTTGLGEGYYVGGNVDCTNEGDEVIGWYSIDAGHCTTTYSGCFGQNQIDFVAIADDGAYWAGSDASWDLTSASPFDYCANNPTNCTGPNCPPNRNFVVGARAWGNLNGCGFLGLGGWGGTMDLN